MKRPKVKLFGSEAGADILKTLFEACGWKVVDCEKAKRKKAKKMGVKKSPRKT